MVVADLTNHVSVVAGVVFVMATKRMRPKTTLRREQNGEISKNGDSIKVGEIDHFSN